MFNKNLFLFFSFAFFLQLNFLYGQDTDQKGYLHIRIYGLAKPSFKLDSSMYIVNDTLLPLSPGDHRIKIWMPTFSFIDSIIKIKSNDTVKYSFSLKHTSSYLKYKVDYSNYKALENKRHAVSPILIALTTGSALIVDKVVAKKHYDNAIRAKELYSGASSQSQMNKYKEEFEASRKKYKNSVYAEYGLYSISGALLANYIRLIIKQKRTAVPIYKEEKIFSRIKISVIPDIESKSYSLNFKLGF